LKFFKSITAVTTGDEKAKKAVKYRNIISDMLDSSLVLRFLQTPIAKTINPA